MPTSREGELLRADFFDNTGGLNISDTPFRTQDTQATGGFNYDYVATGGIRKGSGHPKVNTVADAQLKTLGLFLHNTYAGTKTVIRAAGTKIQAVDLTLATFTALSEDDGSGSDFLSSSSTVPVSGAQFNTTSSNVLWAAGGGMDTIYGVTDSGSPYKVTKNGTPAPTGTVTPVVAAGTSTFTSTGTYRYALAYRKLTTQALSNVGADFSATISATTDKVTIPFSGLTNLNTTKFDKIYVYRSAVSGSVGFTTGDLVAIVTSTDANYVDTGTYSATAQNIPRAGNTILDNSEPPTGTITTVASWKRRLVTAVNSTIYISDLNKPESWPATNVITIPSGGNITALGVISFLTPVSSSPEEFLAVFKERELWLINGSSVSDWALKFIDSVGCPTQPLIVPGNGFITWIDYRGVYLWNGSDKPVYCSRPIENLFQPDGDLNVSYLTQGVGKFFRKFNTIYWFLSDKSLGVQKIAIKMDLRLTLPQVGENLAGRMMDAVFIEDSLDFPVYALEAMLPPNSTDEIMLAGDDAGFLYKMYNSQASDTAIDFTYETKFLDMGSPGTTKRYHKVIVWVDDLGDWDLTLNYWSNYRTSDPAKSQLKARISTGNQSDNAIWDIAFWDVANWDDYAINKRAVVFNLQSQRNNSEGDCLKLKFEQSGTNQPVTIHGFSVLYSELGLRK